MKKIKRIKGFVMNKKTGHTSLAYKQNKTEVSSIGFTHNRFDRADKRKLNYNINPNDNTSCFAKTKVEKQKYNEYRYKDEYKNYRIHSKDKPLINKIIQSDNKKRR